MNLTAYRGQAFQEVFTFRDATGAVVRPPAGSYVATIQYGSFVEQFTNLIVTASGVIWNLTAAQVEVLPYNTLYYTLTCSGTEVARGVLSVR